MEDSGSVDLLTSSSAANEVVAAWFEDKVSRYGYERDPLMRQDTALLDSVRDAFTDGGWDECTTPEQQHKFIDDIRDIALEATLGGHKLYVYEASEPMVPPWFPNNLAYDKAFLVEVYGKNPRLAESFFDKRIAGWHFSNSSSLLSVVRNGGLLPFNELVRRGGRIASGANDGNDAIGEGVSCVTLKPDHIRGGLWDQILGLMDTNVSKVDIEARGELIARLEHEREDPQVERMRLFHQKQKEVIDFINQPPLNEYETLEQELIRNSFRVAYAIKQTAILEERSRVFDDNRDRDEDKFSLPISDVSGEFVVRGGITLEDVGLVLVEKERIPLVRDLLLDHGNIEVADINDIPALCHQ